MGDRLKEIGRIIIVGNYTLQVLFIHCAFFEKLFEKLHHEATRRAKRHEEDHVDLLRHLPSSSFVCFSLIAFLSTDRKAVVF